MLVNVKDQVTAPEISRMLEYALFSDEEALPKAIQHIQADAEIKLSALKHEGEWIGLIGYKKDELNALNITHLAISPEHRNQGYGRAIVLEVLYEEKPERIIAETDEDAVDFYRNIGFIVISLGRLPNGIERFRCVYEVEMPQE
ncbi:GNAT family N-acetyltransferase [Paenibacillus sp. SN-8-1]|uniref:GNAT family N-acetyltransferase n=1 Tax=Paenibacillus sp. SN-8-1 TaxID=3435409 RepID=UPI003D9A18A3